MIKTIYGWDELSEKHCDIFSAEIDKKFYQIIDDVTQEVCSTYIGDIVCSQGRWFLSFDEAKKALLKELQDGWKWRAYAIEEIKHKFLKT